MKSKIFKKNKKSGQAMLISILFFLFISIAIITGLVSPSVRNFKSAGDLLKSKQSFLTSESLIEDVYFRLKNAKTVDDSETLNIASSSATATVTDSGYNEKTITSLGDDSLRQRKNQIVLGTGVGASFGYGVQVGVGGLTMENNSVVNGSVYSNGSIFGTGIITGTALAANSPALFADQSNGTPPHSNFIIFANADSTQDFAQSFQVNSTGLINKVDLYLRKASTPGNLTVRIVADSGGNPGNTTLTSGTLQSSLVSTSYGWVTMSFSSNPELTAGTTYWLVIDGVTNASRFYGIGANDGLYSNGVAKLGQYGGSWADSSPATLDGFFKIYLGGVNGTIQGITIGSGGVGNAYANTVRNSTVAGTIYCQTGSGNNKPCNTSLPDPVQASMPISDQNIIDWKNEAEAGGVISGNYVVDNTVGSIGPSKITGNMTIDNGADLTINGTIWVQGNLIVRNNAIVRLSPSYASSEGVIVVDGTANISNNGTFEGSGTTGSYLMILSTSTSTSAISLANNGGAVILYAANGTVTLANNAFAKSLNGKFIHLNNNASVVYDSGLANANFVNGPSGGWTIGSWKEVE